MIDLTIKYVNPNDLNPYPSNARKHSDEQIDRVCASIKEFGFLNPVIIDSKKNIIVAGHCRTIAARQLGMDKIPTIDAAHLTEQQIKAYCIADNRLAELSEWDDKILRDELIHLVEDGFDLHIVGYEDFNFDDSIENNNSEKQEAKYKEILAVYIECQSEEEQKQAFLLLEKEGFKCKILSM